MPVLSSLHRKKEKVQYALVFYSDITLWKELCPCRMILQRLNKNAVAMLWQKRCKKFDRPITNTHSCNSGVL